MLNAGDKKKYVFEGDVSKENVLEFLENFKSFEYGLTDEVKYEEKAVPT